MLFQTSRAALRPSRLRPYRVVTVITPRETEMETGRQVAADVCTRKAFRRLPHRRSM